SLIYVIPANEAGNTIGFNVVVIDSASQKANSINYQTLTVNGLLAVSLSSTPTLAATLGVGQSIAVNALATGGSGSYTTYNFLIFNTITNTVVGNLLTTSNSLIYVIPANEAGNTIGFNVVVIDSASQKANSINYQTLTVNGLLAVSLSSTPTLAATLGVGQSIAVNALATGGSGSYTTYNFLIFNTITNTVIGNLLTTSNSLIYVIPANEAGNTIGFNVVVSESASQKAKSIN